MWLDGFLNAISGANLIWLLIGTAIGLVIGVLPALGANFGVALMLPFTFGMEPATAIIFLCAIHAACNYGDSIASILLNTPGGPGTVATCWDGYPMAQQGMAGKALGIATLSSFIGGVGTWLFLALMVGPVTKLALSIGAPEYFALGIMALGLISVASRGETMKGLIMACFGLALSTVGQDAVTGLTYRFSFGVDSLEAGIPIVVSTLGVFAISQAIVLLEEGGTVAKVTEVKDSVLSGFPEVIRRPLTVLRSGAVGWFIGILPAMGVSLAGIASYLVEKKYSKEGSRFGQGAPAGLISAEVGKGACVVGDLIPSFALGVPGSVTGAILMAALIIKGIEPGPRFLTSGVLPYTIFAGIVLAQATFLISGVMLAKWFSRIIYIPSSLIAPTIVMLIFMGAFAERNNDFDIWLVILFGILAYVMDKLGYQVVCLVLGLILGPLVEANFHRSLGISLGSYDIFYTRPIAVVFFTVTLLFMFGPYIWDFVRRRFFSRGTVVSGDAASSAAARRPSATKEFLALAFLGLVLVVFLVTGRGYSAPVRMFPDLVSATGLALIVYRLIGVIRHVDGGILKNLRPGPLFHGSLTWQWSLATMVVFALLIQILGFILAGFIFIAGTILLTGGRYGRALLAGLSVGLGVLLISEMVHLALPTGIFSIGF